MTDHICPAPQCDARIPFNMLACRRHWYQVPKPLRDAVWRAWDNGRGAGSAEHTAAIFAAIARMRP